MEEMRKDLGESQSNVPGGSRAMKDAIDSI